MVLVLVLISFGSSFQQIVSGQIVIRDQTILPASPQPRFGLVPHIDTPEAVRAIYMSAWTASSQTKRAGVIDLIKKTSLNSVIIDIKDDTGNVSYSLADSSLADTQAGQPVRVKDMAEFLESIHENGIYIIGRIAVFQDPYFVERYPELAVQSVSNQTVWHDRKGLTWIDPAAQESWEYIAELAEYSYQIGFDEINLDYIRYPTDGNMQDIAYPLSGEKSRSEVMQSFFAYIDQRLREQDIPISADVFGMTTIAADDLGIGQVFTDIFPHFDAIAPMIYPSHYPKGYEGMSNPAAEPYKTITYAMQGAIAKTDGSPESVNKLRPWLQDFDLGATYTLEMVEAQIDALTDLGVDSWMMWDPSNRYTAAAY